VGERELDLAVMELQRVGALALAGRHSGGLDDLGGAAAGVQEESCTKHEPCLQCTSC
jgi:hypothetical protein